MSNRLGMKKNTIAAFLDQIKICKKILPNIRGSPYSTFFRSFAKDRKIQIT